ncbi:MAG TPA: zf-HC2 domain-containing protein [Ignavibacteria bacterium]
MDCDVIKDLLPIYIEKLTSESSNKLIEDHIKSCSDCNETLSKLQDDVITYDKEPEFNEIEKIPSKLIKRVRKNIYEKILISVSIALILGIIIGALNAKTFMFLAFFASISIIVFIIAILFSIPICLRKSSLRKRFKSLGNWTLILSILISILSFIIFRWYFNETGKIFDIFVLEIIYNIIFSLTLRIYSRFRLPKDDIVGTEHITNKKLFIVAFTALIFIVAIITVPVTLLEKNKVVDDINLSFVNDSAVIGKWTTVDIVSSPEKFNPDKQLFKGKMPLNEMEFLEGGQVKVKSGNDMDNPSAVFLWTKKYIIISNISCKYNIKEINGLKYMFFELKNGDVTYFHKDPSYYVLKKEAAGN